MRLAGYLMTKGYILLATAPNEKDTHHNVFYFKDTPQIQDAIQDYLNRR